MSKRRLDAESIRDAILAASGQLDLRPPIGSPIAEHGNGPIGQFKQFPRCGRAGRCARGIRRPHHRALRLSPDRPRAAARCARRVRLRRARLRERQPRDDQRPFASALPAQLALHRRRRAEARRARDRLRIPEPPTSTSACSSPTGSYSPAPRAKRSDRRRPTSSRSSPARQRRAMSAPPRPTQRPPRGLPSAACSLRAPSSAISSNCQPSSPLAFPPHDCHFS